MPSVGEEVTSVVLVFLVVAQSLQVAYAEYELDAIMLTGSCIDHAPGKQLPPPKGLELHLGTEQQPHMVRFTTAEPAWSVCAVLLLCSLPRKLLTWPNGLYIPAEARTC